MTHSGCGIPKFVHDEEIQAYILPILKALVMHRCYDSTVTRSDNIMSSYELQIQNKKNICPHFECTLHHHLLLLAATSSEKNVKEIGANFLL